jgi:hypothetical protein
VETTEVHRLEAGTTAERHSYHSNLAAPPATTREETTDRASQGTRPPRPPAASRMRGGRRAPHPRRQPCQGHGGGRREREDVGGVSGGLVAVTYQGASRMAPEAAWAARRGEKRRGLLGEGKRDMGCRSIVRWAVWFVRAIQATLSSPL